MLIGSHKGQPQIYANSATKSLLCKQCFHRTGLQIEKKNNQLFHPRCT